MPQRALRRMLGAAFACLVLAWATGAAAGEARRGLAAPSPILGRAIPYALHLPDGYAGGGQRYPVLYLLHGHGGSEHDWLDGGGLAGTLDRLTAAGAVPPMIVVMPGMGDGWYVDGPDGAGTLETAFLTDLIRHVDLTWRADGRREARAVAGLSMGGWGAVRFAMLRPDLFVAAASLSGALIDADWVPLPVWHDLLASGFGMPPNAARVAAASPFALIPAFAARVPRPALYLACGDDDELDLAMATLRFYTALRAAGIAAELRIGDGGHDWGVWSRELDPALRFIGNLLAGP